MKRLLIIGLFTIFALSACRQNPAEIKSRFEQRATNIGQQYVPDKSLNVYNVKLERPNGRWTMLGTTNIPQAKKALGAFCDSLFGVGYYQNKLRLLPDANLGDSSYALVKVSVAHLRRHPSHAAELVNQTIMGRTLALLDENGGWYLCQTDYGYVGWISSSSITRINKAGIQSWQQSPRLRVSALGGTIFSKPDTKALPVSNTVLNMEVAGSKSHQRWTKVNLPDGREGYISSGLVTDARTLPDINSKVIIQTAESMLGLPYLWGGNSSKGNDCSGFSQTVFKAHGMQLPRDAGQQAEKGETIIPDSTFSNLKAGDLLFFGAGKRVTHVGISLGGPRFIHQAGEVHFNSFDKSSPEYNAARRRNFKFAKRVLK